MRKNKVKICRRETEKNEIQHGDGDGKIVEEEKEQMEAKNGERWMWEEEKKKMNA